MRLSLLALFALSFPLAALADTPVQRDQCAATTVKALEDGNFKKVAALFSTPGQPASGKGADILSSLADQFGKLGKLSDVQALPRKASGYTIKMETVDADVRFPTGQFSQSNFAASSATAGKVYLDISYHQDTKDCALIAVAIHVPTKEPMHTWMSVVFETEDEKGIQQLIALLKEKKAMGYTLETTAANDKPVSKWKLNSLPFATPGNPAQFTTFLAPFQTLAEKYKGTYSVTFSASSAPGI